MTEEAQARQQTVAAIIKGVVNKTTLIVSVVASAVLLYFLLAPSGQHWWFVPMSILFGGALGLLNFRFLATSVERIYLRKGATSAVSTLAAAIITILKLSLIFIILFVVIKWRLLHIFGVLAGLSLCFLAILWEGALLLKNDSHAA
jgi:ATP synthase I chain